MKAAVVHQYGGPQVLRYEDFPDPVAGEGQILVKLAATSVNPIDVKRRSGAAKAIEPIEFPGILGMDVAGTVLNIGPGVTGFTEGEQVLAMAWPSYAELCAVKASDAVKLPQGLDLVEAAALPTVATTGYTLIAATANVQAGQKVLITGALGMVGRCAVYTAKSRGAYVIAAVLSSDVEGASAIGADQVVATDDASAMDSLPSLDVVADTVGGQLAAALLPKIKSGGHYATLLGPAPNAAQYLGVNQSHLHSEPNAD